MERDGYKSDLRAAHARLQALEQENRELQAKLAAKEAPGEGARRKKSAGPLVALTVVLGAVAVAAAFYLRGPRVGLVAALVFLAIPIDLMIWRRLVQVVGPNELLVISGRRYRSGGVVRGYRVVRSGRTLLFPLLERVERLDLTAHPLSFSVAHMLSRSNARVTVALSANVKIAAHEPVVANAVERFLGRPREEIDQVAQETIEGALRLVTAALTLEEMQEDRLAFAEKLLQELDHDMDRLGLVVDTLAIQSVS